MAEMEYCGAMEQGLSFGEQLRRFRELAGFTQEELAERAGLTAKAIGMLERGARRNPYPHTVRALADQLGLNADERSSLFAALPRRARDDSASSEEPPPNAIPPAPPADPAPPVAPRWEPRIWFPQTKLRPPQVGGSTLPRPHLLAQLRAAVLAHRLTLLAAPAGAGKSTLLAALPGALPGLPVAWLALDAEDNDPTTFVSALVLALRAALPTLGRATEALLDSLPEPGAQLRRLVGTLINDLLAAAIGPFILVLDDLHAVGEPAIHTALDYLLERLPDDAHVVIASRYDPPLALARLRARGHLAEFRLGELRFTPGETGQLLNDQLALDLPHREVATLHERVGGWAAGLRLLALMLGRLPTPEERRAFVARLGEDGRYLFDFLAEEVLGQQEPELQRFLLDIAILPELTPSLCRAVTGRDDAPQLLDRAYRRNLFLTLTGGPIAETGATFRFHDLFAEFLRGRLNGESPEHARHLHRRAARAAADPARAVAHYSAAEAWDEATRVIEEFGPDLARHGLYRRLHDWIMALPEEVRESHPRLLQLLGAYAFYAGRWDVAVPLLERAASRVTPDDRETTAEVLLMLLNISERTGARERAAEAAARLVEFGTLPPRLQIIWDIGRTWRSVRAGDYAATEHHVAECVDLLLSSDDPAVWNAVPLAPLLALGPSGPAKLAAYYEGALQRFGNRLSPARINADQGLGYLHMIAGRLDAAATAAGRATAAGEQLGGAPETDPGLIQIAFALHVMRADPGAAERYLADFWPQIEANALLRTWLPGYRYLRAKAHWLADRPAEALAIVAELGAGGPYADFPLVPLAQQLLNGMLATSAGRYGDAERELREATTSIPPYFSVLFWLDHPRVLLAHCYERWGRPREALETLRPVLEECERLDTPGVILKVGPVVAPLLRLAAERGVHATFAARTLGIKEATGAPATDGIPVPDTGETLSPREVDVLRLLATGEGNAAIGAALFISQNTVKTHVARILAKLGVSTRTQAARRARDLGIG
jgi:LuxR family maltose regulon positive regulatory protein